MVKHIVLEKNDIALHKLYLDWQKSGFLYTLCPSIDRINKLKGYDVDNIRFIPHGENCKWDNDRIISVDVYDKNDNLLSTHKSLNDAVKCYKVQQSNAWKVLHGYRKHTQRYVFKFKQLS